MMLQPSRVGAATAFALHAVVLAALLSYQPARTAILAAAPIMVDWIAAPRPEPKIEAPVEPPKPKPVHHAARKPMERPVIAKPAEAPAPEAAPAPPPPAPAAPVAAVPTPAPATVTEPMFNAAYLQNPAPAYPPLSRRLHEEGRVVLRVHVTVAGQADDVQVRSSSGHSRLDDTARDTVRQWKFVPAKRGADAVAAWVLVPISFKLEG
jgi:protein TonB